jgi:type IV pilus assembly protein PilB
MAIRLGEILVKMGRINEEQLAEALKVQTQEGGKLGQVLIRMGLISEQQILFALSKQFDIPVIDLEQVEVGENVTTLVPVTLARRLMIMPIRQDGGVLTIALGDPTRLHDLVKDVKLLTGCEIEPYLATESSVIEAIEKRYETSHAVEMQQFVTDFGTPDVTSLDAFEVVEEEEKRDIAKLESDAKQPPVVKIVNHCFTRAVLSGASDIHIEPYEDLMRVRFRIDGELYEVIKLPLKYKDGVTSRIKILAKMDISEKRLPQDGRIKIQMKLENKPRNLDVRVSTTPTLFGEKIVMRLLDKEGLMLDMSRLGFDGENGKKFEEAIFRPWGMVLVTGPTGSGKTNTLYSAISRINRPGTNIMTVEDPVEFNLYGINQVQVSEMIHLSFAAVLRSFLRQDPNVILVGEIRDNETAEIAVKASLTGHLVLSTLHTNDAPSAIGRLMDMGIDSYLVATSVILICAQRLVRRICSFCGEETQIPPKALVNIGFSEEEAQSVHIHAGKGCPKCNNTGYKGRTGLYEVMSVTSAIQELIFSHASSSAIRTKAIEEGMITLRRSGLMKIKEGVTTMEEVVRETFYG